MDTRSDRGAGPNAAPVRAEVPSGRGVAPEQFWEYLNGAAALEHSVDAVQFQDAIFRFYLPMAHQEAYRSIADHGLKAIEALQAAELGLASAVLTANHHDRVKFEHYARAAINSRLKRLAAQGSHHRLPRLGGRRIPHQRPATS